ncbi:hypothetical protein N7520_011902 [Penicillium odoratum]|uniref:uncharacterized protein n=1 Tax=Penicillium odoratum TaxID=1167516 RepID=UPI0025492FB5|nr:uncharacterized protein N7520_011902 [Penicillium odoratum]KAJ5746720.1 hypothetical protein N7520_011902 [Penicillium odoratum]
MSDTANQAMADATIDIDMDLDLGLEPEPEPEPELIQTETTIQDTIIEPPTDEAVYEKVHVRGVDELSTEDIKKFATSHFEHEAPTRVEWIDDTSANLIYSSTDVGLQALLALTQVNDAEDASALPPLRLRSAKPIASHPDSVLQVRSAVKSDRKQARSYEKSRFYLMHPEHDPRERLREELAERRQNDGDYRRNRFDDRELRRRRDRDGDENFSANMYDDQPESHSGPGRGRPDRRQRGPRELFPTDDRASGRLRNRSASPGRDTLEEGSHVDRNPDTRRRFRERSPQLAQNKGKELFPSESGTRELFPNKPASSYIKKELFPSKASGHRRSDAFDAADETPDLLGRRITAPLGHAGPDHRIRGIANEDQGFAIRGSAGISIKGRGASVRELFPSKYDSQVGQSANAGKELFSDTLEGRGGRRRRAEDMMN